MMRLMGGRAHSRTHHHLLLIAIGVDVAMASSDLPALGHRRRRKFLLSLWLGVRAARAQSGALDATLAILAASLTATLPLPMLILMAGSPANLVRAVRPVTLALVTRLLTLTPATPAKTPASPALRPATGVTVTVSCVTRVSTRLGRLSGISVASHAASGLVRGARELPSLARTNRNSSRTRTMIQPLARTL